MNSTLHGFAPLGQMGVIRVQGEDAVSFLHGQLTHDVALLADDRARLAAYLTAKGRMLASFIVIKNTPQDVLLVCDRSLLAATLKRLSMFVLRSKAKLSDASAEWQVLGLLGDATPQAQASATNAWQLSRDGEALRVQLPPAPDQARALWIAPVGTAQPSTTPLDVGLWQWAEVRSGVATLEARVVDQFVPQMLNYESVDGVSFKKGCYPGQEVVARSQFRGAIKRRVYIAHVDTTDAATTAPGTEIFSPADLEQPCGVVVQAAFAPRGGSDLIVSLQTAMAEQALQLGATAGAPALQLLPLPYELALDI